MSTATLKYQGNLRTKAEHTASGQILVTDAPKDNNGNGESFSPTDLTAVSLAACMLTMMGITAHKHDIPFAAATATVKKHMAASPRRIHKLEVMIVMEHEGYTEAERRILEGAAIECPVAKSLSAEIAQETRFKYGGG